MTDKRTAALQSGRLPITRALRSANDKLRHEAADTIEALYEALEKAETALRAAQKRIERFEAIEDTHFIEAGDAFAAAENAASTLFQLRGE